MTESPFPPNAALADHNLRARIAFPLQETIRNMTDERWRQLKGRCPGGRSWWSGGAHGPWSCDFCGQAVRIKPGPYYAERGDMNEHDATRNQVEAHLGI